MSLTVFTTSNLVHGKDATIAFQSRSLLFPTFSRSKHFFNLVNYQGVVPPFWEHVTNSSEKRKIRN